jgi:aryl-alcohol dehydrogenase-like predicted oxidoreductase
MDSRLVLGGHSFIQQLGNDPAPDPDRQVAIVKACLDCGVRWFDTTYQPERVALGACLAALGRRREATIIAWNFFTDFAPGGDVGGPRCYEPDDLERMCEQLHTTVIDLLVVHAMGQPEEDRRQEALAREWVRRGKVRRLGTWHPGPDVAVVYGTASPYSFMVRPYNVSTADAGPAFEACAGIGWQTLACSPYVRGWELDGIAGRLAARDGGTADSLKPRLADCMLRYSLCAPHVDRLIVSMRDPDLVARNVASEARGALSAAEREWLLGAARAR